MVLLAQPEGSGLRASPCLWAALEPESLPLPLPLPHRVSACRAGCLPWVGWRQEQLVDKLHSHRRDSYGVSSGKSDLELRPNRKITGQAADIMLPSASRPRWSGPQLGRRSKN